MPRPPTPPPNGGGLISEVIKMDKANETGSAFELFPEVTTEHDIPHGWNEAVRACYNAAGYRAAIELAQAMSFALGAEWIWKAGPADVAQNGA